MNKRSFRPCFDGYVLESRVVLNSTVVTHPSDGSTLTMDYDDDDNMINSTQIWSNGDTKTTDAYGDWTLCYANGGIEMYDAADTFDTYFHTDGSVDENWNDGVETMTTQPSGSFVYHCLAHTEVEGSDTFSYSATTITKTVARSGKTTTTYVESCNGFSLNRTLIINPDNTYSYTAPDGELGAAQKTWTGNLGDATYCIDTDLAYLYVNDYPGDYPPLGPLPPAHIGPAGPL